MIGFRDQVTCFHSDDFLALSQNGLDLSRVLACFVGYCLGKVRRLDPRERKYSSLGFGYDLCEITAISPCCNASPCSSIFSPIILPSSSPFSISGIPFTGKMVSILLSGSGKE